MMNWLGRKVLVTGAGGFVGSHLAERFAELGAHTRALVHYNALGSWGWLDQSPRRGDIEVVAGDICDRDSVKRAMEGVDVVCHLAALIAIPYSYCAPASYVRVNIEGTLNVMQTARDLCTGRIVTTSTSEVYGTARYVPIDEKHPLQGQSPYAASKIGADKIAESFHLSFGVPLVTIRPFNTFGPRQSARAIVPTIAAQCLSGGPVRLGSTHPTRDLNFVGNIVDGFVLAAEEERAVGKTINLGSGREISVADLVHLIGDLTGASAPIEVDRQRVRPEKSEVERLLADNRVAREVLGWVPRVTLEEGLALTVEWIREHLGSYRAGAYNT